MKVLIGVDRHKGSVALAVVRRERRARRACYLHTERAGLEHIR